MRPVVGSSGYERVLRPVVEQKQKQAVDFTGSAVPPNRWRLWLYNAFVRFMDRPAVLRRASGVLEEAPFLDHAYQISRMPRS